MNALIDIKADESPRVVTVNLHTVFPIDASNPSSCPILQDGVTAMVGDVPMEVTPGAYWTSFGDGDGCDQPMLQAHLPDDAHPDVITFGDASATWTIAIPDMLDNRFDIAGHLRSTSITWTAATTVKRGDLEVADAHGQIQSDAVATIAGNVMTFPTAAVSGPAVIRLQASRVPVVTQCDGPSACDVTVWGGFSRPTTP